MRRLLAIVWLCFVPAAAWAQTEADTGSHIQHSSPANIPFGKLSDADRSRYTLFAYSKCLVGRNRAGVERALAMPDFDKQTARVMAGRATPECLRFGELRMDRVLLRGGLFAALYSADYARSPGGIAPSELDFSSDVAGGSAQEITQFIAMRQYADCVVRVAPAESRAVVLAPVATSAENAAFAALGPHLGACLSQGQSLGFSKVVLSGIIAETLYREARAATPAKVN